MPRNIKIIYPTLEDYANSEAANAITHYSDEPIEPFNADIDVVLESFNEAIADLSNSTKTIASRHMAHMVLIGGVTPKTPEMALESFYEATKGILVSAYEKMLVWLEKIKLYFLKMFKGKDKSKITTKENQAKLHKLLQDPLDSKIDGFLALADKAALEDLSQAGNGKLQQIFNRFKETLSDQEADFLTSGTYYRNIKVLVKDWNECKFSAFIKGLQHDIDSWGNDGLSQAKHVGKDVRVVNEFRERMRLKAEDIRAKYRKNFMAIKHLEETHLNLRSAGNLTRLHEFLNKPSALFPHVSNLWKVIEFESMTNDDKALINEIDKITNEFELRIKTMREKTSVDTMVWPAEDAVLQLITKTNQDMLKYISTLAGISAVLRTSAITAFNATNKSFAYIKHILNLVKAMPNVNSVEVERCIDSIDKRHKELEELVQY